MDSFISSFAGGLAGSIIVLFVTFVTLRYSKADALLQRNLSQDVAEKYERRFHSIEHKLTSLDGIAQSFEHFRKSQVDIHKNRFDNDKTFGIRNIDIFLSKIYAMNNDIKSYLDGSISYIVLSQLKEFKKPEFLSYHFFDSVNTRIGNRIADISEACEDFISDVSNIDFSQELEEREKIASLRDQLESLMTLSEELLDSLNDLKFDGEK